MSERISHHCDVTIITLKDAIFYELPTGVQYLPLAPIKNNLLMILFIPYYIYRLRKILRISSFDGWMSSLEIANFIHILANKKAHIAFETSMGFFTWMSGFCYKAFIKLLYPYALKIKVNSEENKHSLAQYLKIDEEKISVIYNPLNNDAIDEKKREDISSELLQRITWRKVFITVARLIRSKFHSKIIDSFKKIYDEGDTSWIYIIVGDWQEKSSLEEQSKNLGLEDNIIFLGAQKNVFKYLNIADYFVYASKIEWFPNVLWEAMACNLPIITSDFKTGAKECILGEYSQRKYWDMEYPYFWPNWVLLDLEKYEENFLEVYKNLTKLEQKKIWFERFSLKEVEKNILEFIL